MGTRDAGLKGRRTHHQPLALAEALSYPGQKMGGDEKWINAMFPFPFAVPTLIIPIMVASNVFLPHSPQAPNCFLNAWRGD
jgi:hypothetical protein